MNNLLSVKKFFILFLITTMLGFADVFAADNSAVIAKKRKETRAKIFRLKLLETQETNKMYRNQQKLEKNEVLLKTSQKQYLTARHRLSGLEKNLEQSKAAYSAYEATAKQRIRQIYKKERIGLFTLILTADNLNTFLDRIYFQSLIAKNDKLKLDAAKQKAVRIARLKAQADAERRILASSIDDITYRKQQITSEINNNANMIHKLKTDRAAYEKAEKELARQSQIIEGMIAKSTRKSSVVASKGSFVRPCPGRITSYFGYRVHPIFKTRKFHSGLDIAIGYGTPIKAANSGKVIYTGWYGGYGKIVIIDHGKINGKPTTTLYAHQSKYAVSNGSYVKKGQVIGYVGSTGYSTGPHLHFEVRINGKPVNPANYI